MFHWSAVCQWVVVPTVPPTLVPRLSYRPWTSGEQLQLVGKRLRWVCSSHMTVHQSSLATLYHTSQSLLKIHLSPRPLGTPHGRDSCGGFEGPSRCGTGHCARWVGQGVCHEWMRWGEGVSYAPPAPPAPPGLLQSDPTSFIRYGALDNKEDFKMDQEFVKMVRELESCL